MSLRAKHILTDLTNKPVAACRVSATQYGESEKCVISFSPKTGDRTLQYSGYAMLPVAAVT
jgi:hypothetical protein